MRVPTILALTAILATAAWGGRGEAVTTELNRDPTRLAEMDLENVLSSNCSKCTEGCDGTPKSHRLRGLLPKGGGYSGHPEIHCYPKLCGVHAKCGRGSEFATAPTDRALTTVDEAIRTASPAELLEVVALSPQRIRINPDRRALQLMGCESQVVASYTPTSVPALAMLLD